MLAPLRRKDGYETRVSSGKGCTQNSVLGKYHGITMQNPTEVTGGPKAMFLKMLTQLGKFLHLAEAVLDNLQGKSKDDSVSSESRREMSDTKTAKLPAPASQSRITLAERGQIRFNHIPVKT